MPVFNYIAIDAIGRKIRGRMDAASETALEGLLEKDGQWLAEAAIQQVKVPPPRQKAKARAPRRMLIEFFLQMSIQLNAGVPIFSALAFGASECDHAGFRGVQKDLLDRVQAGVPLSDAMAGYPGIFPPLVINLIRAGEAGGGLPETCRELHQYYEWLDRLVADVRQALVYPCFVLASTAGFVLLLFTFLIPRFATLLTELNVPLPLLTQGVMGLSDFMVAHWPWIVFLPPSLWLGAKTSRRWSPGLAMALDKLKLSLPIFGNLNRLICLSRFAHHVAVLYQAGIPLLESLRLCRGLVGNRVIAQAVESIEAGVNEGVPMHEVMARQPVFSKLILQMVMVGENTGQLGEALQNVADYYNEVIPRLIKKTFTILEPVMILSLIVLVGTVALSIFLPIANLLGVQ